MQGPNERYLEAILEHSADAIVTSDGQGRVVLWNPASERLFGYTREEMIGRSAEQVWEEPEERRKLLRLLEKKGRVVDYETHLKTKEGRIIDVSITMSQLRDAEGRLIGTVGISKDIRKRKKMERELKRLAITDSLTGLYNRAHFNGQVVEEVERARRMGHSLAVALVDLDGFKEYNDSQGHQAGDGALRKVGRIVLTVLRKHVDSAYRYGGDEFTFTFPECDAASAAAAGERLRAKIAAEVGPAITASVGVAIMRDGEGARELIRRADMAMYKAKGAGGNRVSGPDPA